MTNIISKNTNDLPWVKWAMPGAQFKLLHADQNHDRFTLLIQVQRNVLAPKHRHLGAVEAYVIEGSFYYDDAPNIHFKKGDYLREEAGSVHRPLTHESAILLVTFYGAVEGLNEKDESIGKIDCQWHIRTWEKACQSHTAICDQ